MLLSESFIFKTNLKKIGKSQKVLHDWDFFLKSRKMTSTNMYDREKNFRKLRSIWDNEPGNGKMSKILSRVKRVQKAMKKMRTFFLKSIISILWHEHWQSDVHVIWKYTFVIHAIGQEHHKRTRNAEMLSYDTWENFKYVLKIGDKKFTWYAISLNSGHILAHILRIHLYFSYKKHFCSIVFELKLDEVALIWRKICW